MPTAAPPRTGVERKTITIDRKAAESAGTRGELTAYAATFDLDQGGDRIMPGAFTGSLARRRHRPLLWDHDPGQVVGVEVDLGEDLHGLLGRWKLADTQQGRDMRALVQSGAVTAMSIGYFVKDARSAPDGTRELVEIDLLECSLVSLPMNEAALIQSFKSGGPETMSALAARLAARGVLPLPAPDHRSIGERVVQSAELKAFAAGHAHEARIDLDGIGLKALVGGVASAGPVDIRADLLEVPPAALSLVDVLPVYPTELGRVSVPRIGTSTNAAAPVAEATATTGTSGLKPESGLTFLDGTVPVETIAHWISATRNLLEDAGTTRMIIETELLLGLKTAVENQILNGTGTRPQLAGILGLAAIGSVAVSAGNVLQAVLAAMAQVQSASLRTPTVIVLSPAAWTSAASAAAPGLLGISPRGLPTLLGAEVVQSTVLPAATGLVGVAQTAPILERQQASVSLGLVNDNFIRNITTMLCEVRLALAVSRQNAWCKITGTP